MMSIRTASALFIACVSVTALSAQDTSSYGVRILLGVTDTQSTPWDGSISVSGAAINRLEPWRFQGDDQISGNSWKIATHPIKLFLGGVFVPNSHNVASNIASNGIVAQLTRANDDGQVQVHTAQGDFSFRLADIPFGKSLAELNGRATVDRIPSTEQITSSAEEQDFPAAAADKSGTVWVAYIEFKHAKNHNQLRAEMTQPVTTFDQYRTPTGGDQVLIKRYANGTWSEPIPITASGLDLYKTTISIDGRGRPWVFWSQNTSRSTTANFDIWARPIENGKAGTPIQISREAGSDIEPVATTDSKGDVWIAWQGWRAGKAAIYSAHQNGNGFSAPQKVSSSSANEWNPAIAADNNGRATVAWDSYRNGNYDVYFRTSSAGTWGAETPAAATPRYEAYPSIAYDGTGRLWIAYEEGGVGWGKDYGAYASSGTSLYQGRLIRLRGFEPNGRVVETAADLGAALPGKAKDPFTPPGPQNEAEGLDDHLDAYKTRSPNDEPQPVRTAQNSFPRLKVDASGRLWLAFRTIHPVWWAPMGSTWFEYLVSYDGKRWTKPVFLSHSDNLLDNRPALLANTAGSLMVIGSSDARSQYQLAGKYVVDAPAALVKSLVPGDAAADPKATVPLYLNVSIPVDPYNNDLWVNRLTLGSASQPAVVESTRPVSVPAARDTKEGDALKRMHEYRTKADGLKIVRGEFHRHSEISFDGGSDGAILDQYRYALDAASMDWLGCCDHDNGLGREYTWWLTQKLTDVFNSPGQFANMFSYERSVSYPEGHRNVIFAERGVRYLPRLPITREDQPGHAPDTQMLYAYLKHFNGIVASHTSGTSMGTDWRDNDPGVEPIVEIYQGMRQNYEMPDAPRSNNANDSIGGWRPKGFINIALQRGYKLGFEASSDHISTHLSYCNLIVKEDTRDAVLDAFKKRHIYAATDNIVADVRSGSHMMGDIFSTATPPSIQVRLAGTGPFAKVQIVKDNQYVYSVTPGQAEVDFTWRDQAAVSGKTSYYYVRGEQANGEIVWASPMWITYAGK
jgi:hypothetical protein